MPVFKIDIIEDRGHLLDTIAQFTILLLLPVHSGQKNYN